jgi:alpha-tubulin suppressor-like RCC1 family protein
VGLLTAVFVGTLLIQPVDGLNPDIQGAAYRLYANTDSATPGTALAATNTSASLSMPGQAFRLRTGVKTRADALNVTDMTTGDRSSCLIASGNVYCSGLNDSGQLGNGTTTASTAYVPVVKAAGVLEGKYATKVETTMQSTNMGACAIAEGTVYCWGTNQYFAFSATNRTVPSTVPVVVNTGALAGKVVDDIEYGEGVICAISEGAAYCWGVGSRVGKGGTSDTTVPTAVVAAPGLMGGKMVTKVAAGSGHVCALASGSAYCWGSNGGGGLGNGSPTTTTATSPVAVDTSGVLAGKTLIDMSSGGANTCVMDTDHKLYCWGQNNAGQLGDGSATGSSVYALSPVAVTMSGALAGITPAMLDNGGQHVCILSTQGKSYCWGNGGGGSMGNGTSTTINGTPVATTTSGVLNGVALTSITAGNQQTCGVSNGVGYCWGRNTNGQLGLSTVTSTNNVPALIATTNITPGDGVTLAASSVSYKLQYAQKTAATCAAQTGFADVTANSPIAFNTNAGVANGAAIATNANDPTVTGDTIAQSYVSSTGAFSNPNAIGPNKYGLWDFSLVDNSGLYNQAYCMRVAQSTGTAYASYAAYPEVVTASGVLSVSIVDGAGAPVTTPSLSMPSTTISTSCQAVSGLIGTASQKIRIGNETSSPSWSLNLAATAGTTAKWQHQTEPDSYDYNDPSGSPSGCFSGSDGDMRAGRLTVKPADPTALITPKSGCSTTGLSLGSNAGYSEGVVDSITLVNASSSASTLCYWDITGIGLSQMIPASQPAGTYAIDVTATVLAQ